VLVVEESPRAQDGLARHLEYDEKVVAHFDVRSCSAADVRNGDADGLLEAAKDIVVHFSAEAPGRMLQLLREMVANDPVPSDRLTAVITGSDATDDLEQQAQGTGLSPRRLLRETEMSTGARRLIMHLSSRRPSAFTS
jgi:hypothetical protein